MDKNVINIPVVDIPKLEFCEQNGVLQAFKIIGLILFVVKILVPVLLIVLGTIDFVKALTNPEEKADKEAINMFVKRLIIGIIIFLIPTILDLLLNFVDGAEDTSKGFSACTTCMFNPFDSNKCVGVETTSQNNTTEKPNNTNK